MINLKPPHRWATPDDAEAMTQLVNMAGEGMPLYLWEKMSEAGQSAWDVGRDRARRESGGFSYRNTVVSEAGGKVVAGLIGYPLPDQFEPANYEDMPAMFVPLQQLEDLAPGTWYVNVLASLPGHRGKGLGAALLDVAEQLAVEAGRGGLSIIVADANTGARRLYARTGYIERARRPMVKEGWDNAGENWLLLIKQLS